MTDLSSDRKRYFAWAQELIQKHGVPAAPEISPAFREKYASLLELTERIGTKQKGMFPVQSDAP
jgi:fatty acid synthase